MNRFRDAVAELMDGSPRRAGWTRRPYERIIAIYRVIREGGYPNCSTLAARFEVTAKTIQRDINFMRDSMGIALEYDDIRHGWAVDGSLPEMPGFVMGAEELAALFLARTALDSIRGTDLERPIREAFARLLKPLEGDVRLSWAEMSEVFTRRMPEMKPREVKLFGELADAVIHRHEIHFHYRKLEAEKAAARRVRPYHLGEVDGGWYLIAHDLDRDALRTFALPRITRLGILATRFERPAGFDGRDYLRMGFGIWHQRGPVHLVRVRLRDYAARLAQERRWHPTQEVQVLDARGEKVEVRFEVGALEDVVRWVLGFGSKAEVIGPPELRQLVKEELKLMKA